MNKRLKYTQDIIRQELNSLRKPRSNGSPTKNSQNQQPQSPSKSPCKTHKSTRKKRQNTELIETKFLQTNQNSPVQGTQQHSQKLQEDKLLLQHLNQETIEHLAASDRKTLLIMLQRQAAIKQRIKNYKIYRCGPYDQMKNPGLDGSRDDYQNSLFKARIRHNDDLKMIKNRTQMMSKELGIQRSKAVNKGRMFINDLWNMKMKFKITLATQLEDMKRELEAFIRDFQKSKQLMFNQKLKYEIGQHVAQLNDFINSTQTDLNEDDQAEISQKDLPANESSTHTLFQANPVSNLVNQQSNTRSKDDSNQQDKQQYLQDQKKTLKKKSALNTKPPQGTNNYFKQSQIKSSSQPRLRNQESAQDNKTVLGFQRLNLHNNESEMSQTTNEQSALININASKKQRKLKVTPLRDILFDNDKLLLQKDSLYADKNGFDFNSNESPTLAKMRRDFKNDGSQQLESSAANSESQDKFIMLNFSQDGVIEDRGLKDNGCQTSYRLVNEPKYTLRVSHAGNQNRNQKRFNHKLQLYSSIVCDKQKQHLNSSDVHSPLKSPNRSHNLNNSRSINKYQYISSRKKRQQIADDNEMNSFRELSKNYDGPHYSKKHYNKNQFQINMENYKKSPKNIESNLRAKNQSSFSTTNALITASDSVIMPSALNMSRYYCPRPVNYSTVRDCSQNYSSMAFKKSTRNTSTFSRFPQVNYDKRLEFDPERENDFKEFNYMSQTTSSLMRQLRNPNEIDLMTTLNAQQFQEANKQTLDKSQSQDDNIKIHNGSQSKVRPSNNDKNSQGKGIGVHSCNGSFNLKGGLEQKEEIKDALSQNTFYKTMKSKIKHRKQQLSLVQIKGKRYLIKDEQVLPETPQMRFHTLIKYCDSQLVQKHEQRVRLQNIKDKQFRELRDHLYKTGEFKQLLQTIDPKDLKQKDKDFQYLKIFMENSLGIKQRYKQIQNKKVKNFNYDFEKKIADMEKEREDNEDQDKDPQASLSKMEAMNMTPGVINVFNKAVIDFQKSMSQKEYLQDNKTHSQDFIQSYQILEQVNKRGSFKNLSFIDLAQDTIQDETIRIGTMAKIYQIQKKAKMAKMRQGIKNQVKLASDQQSPVLQSQNSQIAVGDQQMNQ